MRTSVGPLSRPSPIFVLKSSRVSRSFCNQRSRGLAHFAQTKYHSPSFGLSRFNRKSLLPHDKHWVLLIAALPFRKSHILGLAGAQLPDQCTKMTSSCSQLQVPLGALASGQRFDWSLGSSLFISRKLRNSRNRSQYRHTKV